MGNHHDERNEMPIPAKPDAEATKVTITPEVKPDEGVTMRSTDPADNAPEIELTQTPEERATAVLAQAVADAPPVVEDPPEGDDPDPVGAGDDPEGDPDPEPVAVEGEEPDPAAAPSKPKRYRPRAQERINEALRERYRSDARTAVLEEENAQLKAAAEKKASILLGHLAESYPGSQWADEHLAARKATKC